MARNIMIAPSLLSANFAILKDEVEALSAAGCEWVHFDCMDGHFTDKVTYGDMVPQALRPYSDRFFDCHLMYVDPGKHLEYFAEAGADGISIHYESDGEPAELLQRIRKLGCQAGLVLNPDTPIEAATPLLAYADYVMLMGVFPGYSGQGYIPETTERIAQMRTLIDDSGLDMLLEVDGGINATTAEEVITCGPDVLVSGSFVMKHPDGYAAAADFFRAIANTIE